MDLPTKTELTQVVADANYAGIVVRGVSREAGFEDTDSDDAENTVNWMTSLLPIIVLILAGLIIMVLTIYCVYRVQSRGSDKIKTGSRYRMPR
jgi:hypothetical protein